MSETLTQIMTGAAIPLKNATKLTAVALILCVCFSLQILVGQSTTTGGIAGTVEDPTTAAVTGATVTLHNLDNGSTQTVTTNDSGAYQFVLLKPGNYTVQATFTGLASDVTRVNVLIGAALNVNLVAKVQSVSQTVEVTEAPTAVQAETADLTTTLNTTHVMEMPLPGGDLTTVAFTIPGIAMSTGGGYGNFSSHGLPGTSNLFTMNGDDYNDPYLNLNNSGASNLLLGQNEIQEVSVVQNAYSVQYGRNAGAQINYITKSGTNGFHGTAMYNWNGTALNATDFFSNLNGLPKPHAVSNNWGAAGGGPIKRNKLFFFTDTEGLRYVLPFGGNVAYPSPQFQSYI